MGKSTGNVTLQMFIGQVLANYWPFLKFIGMLLAWAMHLSDQFSCLDQKFAISLKPSGISNIIQKSQTIKRVNWTPIFSITKQHQI